MCGPNNCKSLFANPKPSFRRLLDIYFKNQMKSLAFLKWNQRPNIFKLK
jgi:hypothetical protein